MREPLWPHLLTAVLYFGSLAAIAFCWYTFGHRFIFGVGAGVWIVTAWYRLHHGVWPLEDS